MTYCDHDRYTELSELTPYSHEGKEIMVLMEYSICSSCGQEFISTAQIDINEARIRKAKEVNDE